ncbi:MAG: serine/threonine-protein phosphatase [Fuerstiella sp.]|nr:serine/threonine-protein phosphatase [Fuerstiella sp.]MCP4857558.1 serine/threonine-protein phosphatase [Fuerstiella sp.]
MTDQPLVHYASRTDVGMRRAANQDSLAVRLCSEYEEWSRCGHLFVVADGMGGHSVGDLASRIAVESLPLAYFKIDAASMSERLMGALTAGNRAINDKARENPEFADMGTTCTVLSLSSEGAYVGHVGDSRTYRVRDGVIEQLSFDHSLQWEMIRQGRATMDNVDMLHPRNVITRCLGPDQNVTIDVEGPFDVRAGDQFVLCSDGLTGHISDTEIGAVVSSMPPAEASRLLINLANCRGGADNITVVIAHVEQYPGIPGPVVDQPEVSKAPTAKAPSSKKSHQLLGNMSLIIFALLATVGLGLLASGQNSYGLLLICPALILGFVRLVVSTSQASEENIASEALATTEIELQGGDMPALKSPYRSAQAIVNDKFLDFLAEAQSELTQAAKENGWTVDLEALSDLQRYTKAALNQNKRERCVRLRAKAIDALMKELYAKTRRS